MNKNKIKTAVEKLDQIIDSSLREGNQHNHLEESLLKYIQGIKNSRSVLYGEYQQACQGNPISFKISSFDEYELWLEDELFNLGEKIKLIKEFDNSGQFNFIIGENGSGKSTILNDLSNNSEGDFYFIPSNKLHHKKNIRNIVPNGPFSFHIYGDRDITVHKPIEEILIGKHYDYTKNNNLQEYDKKIESIKNQWERMFTYTRLRINQYGVELENIGTHSVYNFKQSSDGEYLILLYMLYTQFLPANSIFAIDEIDTHINIRQLSMLMNWVSFERPDIKFIFTTHNYEFIRKCEGASVFWIENRILKHLNNLEFDSQSWIEKRLNGVTKPLLFCEGNEYTDSEFYKSIFHEYSVVSCGSCNEVKNMVQANLKLGMECVGIIDKDNLTLDEIKRNHSNNIFTLPYRHIENLIVSEKAFELFKKHVPTFNTKSVNLKYNKLKEKIEIDEKTLNSDYKDVARKEFNEKLNMCKTLEEINNIEISTVSEISQPKTFDDYLKMYKPKGLPNKILKDYKIFFFNAVQNEANLAKDIRSEFFGAKIFDIKNN